MKLTDMPNISTVNAQKLQAAGIHTPEELIRLGSREALVRVRIASDPGACLSMLNALEGAIRGVRWHHLPPTVREELTAFYKTL